MKKYIFVSLVCFLTSGAYGQSDQVPLDRIVVTSTRSNEFIQNAPNDISVIERAEIEMTNARTIPDVLRTTAGVYVKEFSAGNAKQANIDIRGFGEAGLSNVLVLVDGRRVTQIDMSGTDWAQIPLSEVERIEIVRGAASVFYGDNASGGVVNIITRTGRGKPSLTLTSTAGSFASYDTRLEASGKIKEFDFYAMARYYTSDGYRANNDIDAQDFGLDAGYGFSDTFHGRLRTGYHSDHYGLPGPLNDTQLYSLGPEASVYPKDDAESKDYFGTLSLENDCIDYGKLLGDISMRVRDVKANYMSVYPWQTDNYITTFGLTPKYVLERRLAGHNNKLTLGFDFYDARDRIKDGPPVGDNNIVIIGKQSYGGYLFDQFSFLDNLTFSGGYRFERAEYTFDQIAALANRQFKRRDFNESVFTTGLNYIYDDRDSNLFCNFAQSFRFPLVDEFFSSGFPGFGGGGLDTTLRPQSGNNYEFGARHRFTKYASAGVTVFWMDLEDEIYWDPYTMKNSNYDRTRRTGIESEFKVRLMDRCNLAGGYTYTDAHFRSGAYDSNRIPAVPVHKWTAGFDIDLIESVNVYLLASYVGTRRFISDLRNTFSMMGNYTTVDVRLQYKKAPFSLYAGISNIFDEEYFEYGTASATGTAKNYYPAPGRNFLVGGSLQF